VCRRGAREQGSEASARHVVTGVWAKRGWIATNLPENERSQLPRLGQKENKINKKSVLMSV